jgi:hypothetical protein
VLLDMTWLANSLWELIGGKTQKLVRVQKASPKTSAKQRIEQAKRQATEAKSQISRGAVKAKTSMQDRYDAIVVEMKKTYNVQVRKWRKNSSGLAWEIRYRDGSTKKFIAAPYPRGPMSCAIFLHEIGHHAIGLGVHRPRCLEEYVVWTWALDTMRKRGFNVTPAVEKRVDRSLRYAVRKARRRGLRELPPELVPYL